MSLSEITRSQLYADLSRFGQSCEYERALKVANKVLHHYPNDIKVFQYKIICLVHLGRFEDALLAFTKTQYHENLEFEKAYCQYRLNQTEEALQTIMTAPSTSLNNFIKLNELKAQVYYRLERYEECFTVYRDIIKVTSDQYEEERQTNLAAVIANISANGKNMEMPAFVSESYELCYNIACQLIGKGQILEGERKLKHAEKLCRESLDEDAPIGEIEEEIAIIKVQQAYCMQIQGREKDAQIIYNTILKQKPSDAGLVAIASSNSVAINRDQHLFDSKKKIKNATIEGLRYKLTTRQRQVIAINNCLLNMYTSQSEHGMEMCEQLIQKFPASKTTAILIKACILLREKNKNDALSLLENYANSCEEEKLTMKLAIVQILLKEGEIMEACKVLENLDENTYKPGIISALATLYLELRRSYDASNILQKAVSWYRKNKTTTGDLSALWRHAADLHIRGGQPEVAASSLEELLKINPNDSITLAQLIIAYAQCDSSKAKSLSVKLPNMVNLTPNIDIDTLESSNWMMGLKVLKRAAKTDPSPGTPNVVESIIKKKTTKKRKGKLPKNYDPNVDPDPERWLPRHERSTFRKKKDRRNRDVGKGTQGAAASTYVSDQFDITKMTPTPKSSTNAHINSVQDGPRQQQRKVQYKKKKSGK